MNSVKTSYCDYLQSDAGARIYNDFKQLLYSNADSLVQVLDQNIIGTLTFLSGKRLSVCDIGGGDGKRITAILKHLHKVRGNSFNLDFIEQSRIYSATFGANPVGSFCTTRIHNKLFEETSLPLGRFDVVFLIHSIFAFNNEKSLDKVLSLRKPKGKVIVVSNAPNSFLGGLKDLVDRGFTDHRYELDDLGNSLISRGVSCFMFPFSTKFSLDADLTSTETQTLLEWISLGRFEGFPNELKDEIYKYIRQKGHSKDGRLMLTEKEIALVIPDHF